MPSLTSFSPVSPDHRKSPIAWSISINQITHSAEESVTHAWIGNCSIKWKLRLLTYSLLLISSCLRNQGKVGWRRIHSIAWVSKHSRECVLLVLSWTPAVLGNKSARKKKNLSWILFLLNFFSFIFGCTESLSLFRFSLVVGCGLLIAVASLVGEHRLWGAWASIGTACGFHNCGTQA